MILDSSAVVAIVFEETGYQELLAKIAAAPRVAIGAPTIVETGIVLSARLRRDARGLLTRLLAETGVDAIPFTDAHFGTAIDAWLRFGKGRHPAALNFGDCLSYAVAHVADEPLLCIGEDFARTDLALA